MKDRTKLPPKYWCVCGDAHLYFGFKKTPYTEKEVQTIFEKRIGPWKTEVFPGLVLRDKDGTCYRPDLKVVLVPTGEKYEPKT